MRATRTETTLVPCERGQLHGEPHDLGERAEVGTYLGTYLVSSASKACQVSGQETANKQSEHPRKLIIMAKRTWVVG